MLHRVIDTMGTDVTKYYDLSINNDKMISGDLGGLEYEICRTIVGLHRSNSIFLDDCRVFSESFSKCGSRTGIAVSDVTFSNDFS